MCALRDLRAFPLVVSEGHRYVTELVALLLYHYAQIIPIYVTVVYGNPWVAH